MEREEENNQRAIRDMNTNTMIALFAGIGFGWCAVTTDNPALRQGCLQLCWLNLDTAIVNMTTLYAERQPDSHNQIARIATNASLFSGFSMFFSGRRTNFSRMIHATLNIMSSANLMLHLRELWNEPAEQQAQGDDVEPPEPNRPHQH